MHNYEKIIEAVIKRCPKVDQDDRPKSQQQYCLYTHDESRLLGRHPTKEDALKQERVIQIHKHKGDLIYSHYEVKLKKSPFGTLIYSYNKKKNEVTTMSHKDEKGKTTYNSIHPHVGKHIDDIIKFHKLRGEELKQID
jgi:hypothetical protein